MLTSLIPSSLTVVRKLAGTRANERHLHEGLQEGKPGERPGGGLRFSLLGPLHVRILDPLDAVVARLVVVPRADGFLRQSLEQSQRPRAVSDAADELARQACV